MTPEHDALDERYRWCIYCRADCWPDPAVQQHHRCCPVVIGLYPVTWRENDDAGQPPRCGRCHTPFQLGGNYTLLDVDTGRPAARPDHAEIVCVGCAALADTTEGT